MTVTDECGATVSQDVTITLTGRNDNPVAAADLLYVSNEATDVELPAALLLFNDSDDGGKDNLRITSMSGPVVGGVQSVQYDPVSGIFSFNSDAFGVNGGDEGTFTYTVEDAQGGSSIGTVTVRLVDTTVQSDVVLLSNEYTASYISLNNGEDRAQGEVTVLAGNAQVDYLFGDNGIDKLIGGAGDDLLTGGTGPDEFRMISPASNGSDLITDFRATGAGSDRIYLLQGGGDWNAAGSSPMGDDGANLAASDYLTSTIAGFAGADKNNKVVELSEAVAGDDAIKGLTSNNADNAYVLLFNSVSSRGEIWWDDNWSNSSGRLKIATIDNFTSLTSVTNSTQSYFGEWV